MAEEWLITQETIANRPHVSGTFTGIRRHANSLSGPTRRQ